MSIVYIGNGGWAYFQVPGMDSLSAYAKAFDFVEVNSTFYTNPSIEMVRSCKTGLGNTRARGKWND